MDQLETALSILDELHSRTAFTAVPSTREEWMIQLADRYLWPRLEAGYGKAGKHAEPVKFGRPKVRLSIGFPKASGGRGKAIGQCWSQENSDDGTFEIFISPELDVRDVVHVLLHELVHAVVGIKVKHKKPFRDLARAVGLTGKMTATVPGENLHKDITEMLMEMSAFPHAPLRPQREESKQTTRLIKAECDEGLNGGCGYTVRITRKWLAIAAPTCPDSHCVSYGLPLLCDIEDEEPKEEKPE